MTKVCIPYTTYVLYLQSRQIYGHASWMLWLLEHSEQTWQDKCKCNCKNKKKTRPKILLMTTLWRHQVWSHSFSLWRHVNEAALDGCCHGNGPMPVLHPSSSFFWFLRSPSVSYLWLWTSTWSHVLHKCRRWQLTSSSLAPACSAQCSVTSTAILHLWELASAWTEPSCQDVFKASHHDKVWDNKDV